MDEATWQKRAAAHARRVDPWVRDRLARRERGESHAVRDFLFEYYPYSPRKLATWHPGHGVVLEGAGADAYLEHAGYVRTDAGVTTDIAALAPRRARLDLAIAILSGTAERTPVTGCFALHEWAMVHGLQQEDVRHEALPLRLTPAQISATIDEVGLRCTHIDAYRFFTTTATPRNAHEPTRATQPQLEQPGCLHASMDLYKYAFWFSPFVSSDLIADCFENAMVARELDMRASPYDVSGFGLTSIRVETPDGRREYAAEQAALIEATAPLRARLLGVLTGLRGLDTLS